MGRSRQRIAGLNEEQVMHAMGIDDAYRVERVLARGIGGVTERVTIDGAGPFIRKKMPSARADRGVWAAIASSPCPRLPQIAATYEMPDCFVAVYDAVPGDTLQQAVAARGALAAEEAVQVALDVCEAAEALHACGVIHRDISPENVIWAADGAHLIDFGNARLLGARDMPGAIPEQPVGTWGFAAPEQYGFADTDVRTDVYAIGRLLGYVLTGVRPERDAEPAYRRALADEARVPPALRAVVERASAFEPSARYQRAADMAEALERAAGQSTAHEHSNKISPVPASDAAAPIPRRPRPARVALIAAAVLVALALCGAAAWALHLRGLEGSGTAQTSGNVSGNKQDKSEGSGSADESLTLDQSGAQASAGASGLLLGASEEDIQRAAEALTVIESGWDDSPNGYVDYAVTIRNAGDDLTVLYPEVIITGRAADGSVVFTKSQYVGVLYPGESITFSGLAGNGTAPETVEFACGRPQGYQVVSDGGTASQFEVSGLTRGNGTFSTVFTGELTTVADGSEPASGGQVMLSLVFRDARGRILSGYSSFVSRPKVGESVPFELQPFTCPDYASVEVHALAW